MSNPNPARPEYVRDQVGEQDFGVVKKPLTTWERVYGNGFLRKAFILLVLAAIWQGYALYVANPLVLPTFSDTFRAFASRIANGELLIKSWVSIKVLLPRCRCCRRGETHDEADGLVRKRLRMDRESKNGRRGHTHRKAFMSRRSNPA